MNSIFVAQWFNDTDRDLVSSVGEVLYGHGIVPVTGKVLGGQALDEGVKQKIARTDGLVALATRREELAAGGWTTHPWVINEYDHAKSYEMKAIALVEDGIAWSGMYANHEYIPLDRSAPHRALLQLSQTVARWKDGTGRPLKLRVLPEPLAQSLKSSAPIFDCQYRLVEQGERSDWHPTEPVAEPGGVFLYVKGVRGDQLVEVRIRSNQENWQSPATPQSMPVELEKI